MLCLSCLSRAETNALGRVLSPLPLDRTHPDVRSLRCLVLQRYYDDNTIVDGDIFHPIRIKRRVLDRFLAGFKIQFNNCSAAFEGRKGEKGEVILVEDRLIIAKLTIFVLICAKRLLRNRNEVVRARCRASKSQPVGDVASTQSHGDELSGSKFQKSDPLEIPRSFCEHFLPLVKAGGIYMS